MNLISESEIEAFRKKIRGLSNRGRFKQAYSLSKIYAKKYPNVLLFAYMEAVYLAEDTSGLSKTKVDQLYSRAARKLKKLFPRIRTASPRLRRALRNEYYWFSKQPYKQYRLGLEYGRDGYYSVGVGAAQLARQHGNHGRQKLCRKWAKISEKAWLNFFSKIDDKWFNSYMFYAMALAYQGKVIEMEKAIARGARIAGKTKNWLPMRELRADIYKTLRKINRF